MGAYTEAEQAKQFVERTLLIIKQYDAHSSSWSATDKLDVTLRINCLIGLVVVPQQYSLTKKQSLLIDKKEEVNWGVRIKDLSYGRCPTAKNGHRNDAHEIAKHIRNSIAHNNRFRLKSYEGLEITHIEFTDYSGETESENTKTFHYEFEVSELEKFCIQYATNFLA